MRRPPDIIGARAARTVRKVGRPSTGAGLIVALLAGLCGTLVGACFHPRDVPCAFSCVSPGARCPTDFTCGTDGLCHRDGADGVCTLTPPDVGAGGAGGGSSNAGVDGSTESQATDSATDVVTP
jgi:hypothetical protein